MNLAVLKIMMVPAVSGVLAVLLIGAALLFFYSLRREKRRPVVPANLRPFLGDDELETSRLERMLQAAVILTFLTSIILGVYFVLEPQREASAFEELESKAVDRGAIVFGPDKETKVVNGKEEEHTIPGAYNCQSCHGAKGVGGSAAYTPLGADGKPETEVVDGKEKAVKLPWLAPSLNDVFLRFTPEQVRTIITYGRAGTPMGAWGIDGGGSMTPQQIEDAIHYLESIQVNTPENKQDGTWQKYLDKNAAIGLVSGEAGAKDAEYDGAKLFDQFCARCHTIGFSIGRPEAPGSGGLGPSLRGETVALQFPKVADQEKFITEGSTWQKAYGTRGIGTGRMPAFGRMLVTAQIKAIVEYERSLGVAAGAHGADATTGAAATAEPATSSTTTTTSATTTTTTKP